MDGFKLNDVSDVYVGSELAKQVYVGDTKVWDRMTPPVYTAPTVKAGLVYNGSAQELLNAGSTSDGTIQYSSDGSAWSTDIPTGTNAGDSITVYWRLVGDSRHSDIAATELTAAIAKVTPTVTAPTAKTGLTYTGSAQELINAGSVDYGTLQYSLDNSTWNTYTPTGVNADSYAVYYRVVGDSNVNDVAADSIPCSIGKAAPAYTAPTAKTGLIYAGSAQNLLNAGTTSDGTMQYSLDNSTWGTSIPTGINATDYTVYWRLVGDGNHTDVSSTNITVSIAKVTPAVTAPTAKTLTYTGSPQALANEGSTDFGTLQYSSDGSTWEPYVPTGTNADSYTVYYRVVGDSNVNDVAADSIPCSIGKAVPSYTTPTAKTLTYNGNSQELLDAGFTGHGTIQYSADGSTWSTSIPTGTNAASYTAYWRLVGDSNHNDVAPQSIPCSIGKVTPTVTAPTAKTLTYSGVSQALVNAGSTNWGTLQYSLDGSTWGTDIPTATNASDSYTVYWRVVGDSNINDIDSDSVACAIGKVTPTVTAPTAEVLTYNGEAQALANAGSTNFGTLEYSLDNSSWSTSVPTATNAGSYTVYYKVDGDSNINSIPAKSISCSISERPVTATVTLSQDSYTYNGSACTPGVTVKDGTTVIPATEYTVTYSNNVDAGTATVTVTDNVGGNYDVIGSATFTIGKAPGSVSVSPISVSYNGNARDLVSVSGNTGTMHYRVGSGSWSTDIPTAVNASDYDIYWYMDESANYYGMHSYSSPAVVSSSIAKIDPSITEPTAKTGLVYNGSAQSLWNAGSNITSGSFYYSTGTDAGSYDAYWSFTPSDTTNYNSMAGGATVSIDKAPQDAPIVYDASAVYPNTATASASGGGGVGSLEWESAQSQSSIGSHTTRARWTGNSNYYPSPWSNYATVTMSKAAGEVSISGVSLTYNGDSRYLASVSGNTGTMHYSTDYSNWSTDIPTATDAGSWTIYWYMDATANYEGIGASTSRYVSSSIAKADQSAPTAYGSTSTYPDTATASASGGGGVGSLEWESAQSQTSVGSHTTRARWSGNGNYNPSPWSDYVTVQMVKAAGSVSISGVSITYNGNWRDLASVSGNTGTMYYSTDYSNWSTSIPSAVNAGSWTVYWYMDATSNYEGISASTSRYVSSSIAKADQSAPTAYDASTTYPTAATASASGGGGVGSLEWESAQSQESVGSHSTRARWTGDGNYNPSPWSNYATVTMSKAAGEVSISGVSLTYNGYSRNLASVSGNTGTMHYSTDYSNWSTDIPTATDAGSWTIYWYMDATANYEGIGASTSRYVSSSIAKADQSAPTAYGSTSTYPDTATASASGGGGVGSLEWESAQSQTSVGSHTTRARWSGNGNYNPSPWSDYVTVQMVAQAITIPAPTGVSKTYDGNAATASFGAATGATITKYRYSTNGSSWTETSSNPSQTNAGTLYVQAYYSADTNYTGSGWSTSATLAISKASRTLSFANSYVDMDINSTYTQAVYVSAGSGDGAITYSVNNTSYATVNSSTGAVTSKSYDGSITVTASIAEGTNYLSGSATYNITIFATVHDFSYTGAAQTVALLGGSSYKIQCWGAQGGANAANSSYGITAQAGGKGGYSEGTLSVLNATLLKVYVGGQGTSSAGGFNGGGSTTGASSYSSADEIGVSRMAGGGGASDVRLSDGELLSRFIVAGGGSGGAMSYQKVATQTTTWSQVASGNSGDVAVWGTTLYRSYMVYLSDVGLAVGDTVRVKYTVSKSYHADTYVDCYPQKTGAGNTGQYRLSPGVYQEFTIPANTDKISINSGVPGYQTTVAGTDLTVTYNKVIDTGANKYISTTAAYHCVWYPVTALRGSKIKVTGATSSWTACIAYTTAIPSLNTKPSYATGWSAPVEYGNDIETTVPANASYLYIRYAIPSHTYSDQNLVISKYPHEISGVIEKGTATTTYTENRDSKVGYVGGGTTGGGYSSAYQGRQNAAGSGGAFGQGAGHSVSNYRYCAAGGGGGWYGGGTAYSNSGITYCRVSGGGSGFVNTAANASYRPSGYTGLELDSGSTYAGNTTFVAPGGGNETGHAGNGYVRITRL